MTSRLSLCAALFVALAAATPAAVLAAPVVPAAAEPLQFYVFSFTDAPADEAAQDVVAGALARDLTVDPAVDGVVSFRTEGWSGSEALLRDFGTALLDQDIALMRTGPGAYALIPRANVPMLMARGGVLMRLPEPASAGPATPAATAAPVFDELGPDHWWDSAATALLIFFAGAASGAAALWNAQRLYRSADRPSRRIAPVLRLTDRRERIDVPVIESQPDPDLIIPRFDATR
ncbi:hypothetical protein [Brevundimonas sp. R86498]|uniref:hypothetical protein n=1 Tax=Brevundimonas sp. R86498 TaxID=3093845 RepID=UPI0037CB69AE